MLIVRCFSPQRPVSAPLSLLLLVALFAGLPARNAAAAPRPVLRLNVSSTTFRAGARLPVWTAYVGCAREAQNRSPALQWTRGPIGTRSYAVVLFDPDAPTGHGFVHWVLVNVAPSTTSLRAGAGDPASNLAPPGARAARNDFGSYKYGGPCPPPGDRPHHYVFTVDAVDVARLPGLARNADGPAVRAILRTHILAEGTLTGRFGR